MDEYKCAWETRSPVVIRALFTENARYFVKPFDAPLTGKQAIVEYWEGIQRTQRDVCFDYEILAVVENTGVVHWGVGFTRRAKSIRLDGVMVVSLNGNN